MYFENAVASVYLIDFQQLSQNNFLIIFLVIILKPNYMTICRSSGAGMLLFAKSQWLTSNDRWFW